MNQAVQNGRATGNGMRILVASDTELIAEQVKKLIRHDSRDSAEVFVFPLRETIDRAAQIRPEVVVIVFPKNPEHGLALINEIQESLPCRILALGPTAEAKLILRTLRQGAYQYIDQEEIESELSCVLSRLRNEPPIQTRHGRVISVVGVSGGSGTSTLATNVATSLSKSHQQCALLDLNLETGDLAALLDLQPAHTLADFCQHISRMDRSMFEMCFEQHPSGVRLLSGPWSCSEAQKVTARGVRKALNMARMTFPYVVIDVNHSYRREYAEALFQSDVILLVIRMDFSSLRRARRVLDYFVELDIPPDRLRLVVNRFRRSRELRPQDVEKSLGMRIASLIPEDATIVNRANNKGVPVILEKPRAEVSRSLLEIARSVNGKC